ncbi:pyridoxamine 5'-phosphate oxidase family protein [Haladaptatus sp. NG-WS-4]
MSEETPTDRSDDVRLIGRAVEDEEWIEAFLEEEPMGVVGLVDEGAPYVVNQLFVYDSNEQAVFLHGAATGRTRSVVERDGNVEACLTVSRMGRLIPAAKPVDFDVEYASVVVFGEISLVEDTADKRRALELLMAKFAPQLRPGDDYEPIADDSIERTSVYRIDVDGWSAKRNETPPDDETAYDYRAIQDEEDD